MTEGAQIMNSEVSKFYDSFMDKMIGYRLYGNRRIEEAIRFMVRHITPTDVVVDIGCGIGIATESFARRACNGRTIGLDISPKMIDYATKTVRAPHISFHCLHITTNPSGFKAILQGMVDVFALVDVIEHFPAPARSGLFKLMAQLMATDGRILIAYPTPASVRHSQDRQIIDNEIPIAVLADEAEQAGLSVVYYEQKSIWNPFDYAHCLFIKAAEIDRASRTEVPAPLIERVMLCFVACSWIFSSQRKACYWATAQALFALT